MTNKDLSRELCEICGIKGKWLEYTTETTDGCVNSGKKRIFPDFTQPENFVKLFELDIPGSTVTVGAAVCFCNRRNLNNRNDFLEAAIQQAKYNKDIRQAIKSEVWKYD
ncbi:hypothetical protein DBY21_02755 [Candidatus Gastranaerophilales bacterium]|nr:MAG: hypothetical protein DBY21_02755 [Candidatus Gastranaerophilales bacterium]